MIRTDIILGNDIMLHDIFHNKWLAASLIHPTLTNGEHLYH